MIGKARMNSAKNSKIGQFIGRSPNEKEKILLGSIAKRIKNASDPEIKKALKKKRAAILKGVRNRYRKHIAAGAAAKVGAAVYLLNDDEDSGERK